MHNNEFKKYFKKRVKNLLKELQTDPSKRTPESFHKLRVEIKKIKAFYSFIFFINKKFSPKKHRESFKKIYDQVGKIRETHIHQNILSHLNNKNIELIDSLQKKRTRFINKFEKYLDKQSIKKIEKTEDEVLEYLKNISNKEIEKYNNRVMNKIEYISKKSIRKNELHETRKQLKEFLYNFKFSLQENDKLIVKIDKIQETLGLWHDNDETINYLKKLMEANDLSRKEQSNIKGMRTKLINKNKLLHKKINFQRLTLIT